MFKQLVLCAFVLCALHASAQTVSLTNQSGGGPVVSCTASSTFQFLLTKSSNFSPTDTVFFNFGFIGGVELYSFSVAGGGPAATGFTSNTAFVTGISSGATAFTVNYQLNLNCTIAGSGTFSAVHGITYDLNHGSSSTVNSSSYSISPPSLIFSGGSNLDYNLAQFNVPITRRYVFRNSANTPFTGYFIFNDTIFFDQNSTSFRLDSAYTTSPGANELSHAYSDSSIYLTLQINNLAQNDSIVIFETGYLFGCQQSSVEISTTRFEATYGCDLGDICKQVNYTVVNSATAHFDPNDKPIALLTTDEAYEDCLEATTHLIHVIKNTGAGAASGGFLWINLPISQPFTLTNSAYYLDYLDINSLQATVNGQIVPTSYTPIAGTSGLKLIAETSLNPGDSIVFEYDVIFNCISPNDYGNYANRTAFLHSFHHPLYGILEHPCAPPSYSANHNGNSYLSHPQRLSQSFNSLIGQMNDGTTEWFHVDNASPLVLGNLYNATVPVIIPQGTTYLVPYDLNSAVIEVRLQMENGFQFPYLDSINMSSQNGATTTFLFPFNTYVVPGAGLGTGDEVVAQFSIPNNWSLPFTQMDHEYNVVTQDFLQFFNSFKVNFLLEADCSQAPTNGVVHVQQQFFIQPTPSCTDCKLPLSEVSTLTNINCPGCVLPGWNLTSFGFERQNIGYEDSNNNHLPDSYSPVTANPANVNLAAGMVGDTLKGSITAFVSDGQDSDSLGNPVGFTFASAGFLYDEGMVLFSDDVISDLKFVGGTGSISIGGINYPFTVPASAAQVASNGNIGIPMNIAALNSYGVAAFSGFDATVLDFTFDPLFKIFRNLDDASGSNSYLDARRVNCFLYMGGTEFTAQGLTNSTFIDVTNPGVVDDLLVLDGAGRAGYYKYWCTAYEGRFLGVGMNVRTTELFAKQRYYNNGSICSKFLKYQYLSEIGNDNNLPLADPAIQPAQSSANIFYNEVRPMATMDTLTFNFPPEYEPYSLDFYNYDIAFDSSFNVHKWSHLPFSFDLNNAVINNDNITIYPSQYIDQITSYPLVGSYYTAHEENQVYDITLNLRPKDCNNVDELVPYTNNTIEVSFSNYPIAVLSSDTSYSETISLSSLKNNLYFTNPNPELNLIEQSSGVSNGVNYWDVSLATNAIFDPFTGFDQATIHSAENVFMTFASPSGNFSNFNIGNITTYTNSVQSSAAPTVLPSWNGTDPVYGLNFLGYFYDAQQLISKQFTIQADFDCSGQVAGTVDSIYVIKGWNCFNYPTSLAEACFADTAVLYFTVPETAIQVTVIHEDTISTCTTTEVSIQFDPTVGETDSLMIALFDSPSSSYTYVPGSAFITLNGVDTYIDPTVSSGSLTWELTELGSIFNDPYVFNYQVQTGCNFEMDSVFMNIQAFNYCGLMILDLDNYWSPTYISNLPEQDSLGLEVDTLIVQQCGEEVTLSVTVSNLGTVPTSSSNTIQGSLPFGFSYTGNNPLISANGSDLTFSVPANVNPSASFTYDVLLNSVQDLSCDTLPLFFTLNYSQEYACGTETCFYSNGQTTTVSSAIIIELPSLLYSNINTDDLCSGNNTISITVQASDTTSGNISVIDLNTNLVLGSAMVSLSTTAQSSSIVLSTFSDSLAFVYDGCACTDTFYYAFTCVVPCIADASFTVDHLCVGDTLVATPAETEGSHLWTYSFFNMTSTADTALFPAATVGTYSLTHIYTNLCGDVDTSTQVVQVNYPIFTSIVLQGSSPFCSGDSVSVTVLNANNYVNFDWNTGDTSGVIWVDTAGVYHVNVTDTNGCVSYCPSIALSTVDGPDPIRDTVYMCDLNSSLVLDAGPADTYLWSNSGASTQQITVSAPGVYTVQVCNTVLATCCVMDTFWVLYDPISFDLQDTVICSNQSTTIASPINGSAYEWSTTENTASISVSQSGMYWLNVQSLNGCSYTDTFMVAYIASLDASFTFADTICTSDSMSCFYPVVNQSPVDHHWIITINGSVVHAYDESPCLQFSTTGTVEIVHVVSNACEADTAIINMEVVAPIENGCITLIGQNPFCEGDSLLLTTSGSYVSIEWMDQFGNILGYGDTLAVYSGGSYSANAVDVNGCVSTCICTTVQTIPFTPYHFPDTTLCTDASSITFTIPDGIGSWSTGTIGQSETFTSTGLYTVDVTTLNGCSYIDTFKLVESTLTAPIDYANLGNCIFHFFSLPQQANCVYTWTLPNGSVIGTTNDFYHDHTGISNGESLVTLVITDTLTGCSTVSSITVKWKGCNPVAAGVYPNPFSNEFTLEYHFEFAEKIDLVIYDMTGQPVYREALDVSTEERVIDLQHLANGVYVVKLLVDDSIEYHQRIAKENH